jgi:hypothetical protein
MTINPKVQAALDADRAEAEANCAWGEASDALIAAVRARDGASHAAYEARLARREALANLTLGERAEYEQMKERNK